jgi:hypothetical protein
LVGWREGGRAVRTRKGSGYKSMVGGFLIGSAQGGKILVQVTWHVAVGVSWESYGILMRVT